MDVKVKIPHIGIDIRENQIKLLRSILEDNVSGEMIKSDTPKKNITSENNKQIVTKGEHSISSSEHKPLFVDILVNVDIDSIDATILRGDGYDAKAELTPLGTLPGPFNTENPATSLLSGDLKSLKVNVKMNSDDSMDVKLSIQDLFVKDARVGENENKFRNLFTTRLTSKKVHSQPYFQLSYRQHPNNAQDVKIDIYHPTIIVIPEIWITTLLFIQPFTDQILACVGAFTSFWADFSPKLSPNEQQKEKVEKETVNEMKVSLYMINAQMCMVEDAKKDKSNAFLVQTDLDIIYSTSQAEEKDVVFLTGRRIEIRRSNMAKLDISIPVVAPFTATILYNDNRSNMTTAINIGVHYIESSFTYRDAMVMQKMIMNYLPELNRLSELGANNNNQSKSEEEKTEDEKKKEETKGGDKKEELFSLTTQGARLVLVDDSQATVAQRPLLLIQIQNCCNIYLFL